MKVQAARSAVGSICLTIRLGLKGMGCSQHIWQHPIQASGLLSMLCVPGPLCHVACNLVLFSTNASASETFLIAFHQSVAWVIGYGDSGPNLFKFRSIENSRSVVPSGIFSPRCSITGWSLKPNTHHLMASACLRQSLQPSTQAFCFPSHSTEFCGSFGRCHKGCRC